MSQGVGKKDKAEVVKITEKGTLVIPRSVFDTIATMHVACITKEWSGIVFYKIIEGDINDPASLVLRVTDIKPCNIGSGGYTEYDFDLSDPYVYDAVDRTVEDLDLKIGNGHSHNSMSCFFSGVDQDDLEEQAAVHQYYLSLIFNYKHDITNNWCAKIGILGEEILEGVTYTKRAFKSKLKYNNWLSAVEEDYSDEKDEPATFTKRLLQTIDFNIIRDEDDDWSDVDRAIELQSKPGYTSNGVKAGQSNYQHTQTTTYVGSGTTHQNHSVTRANFDDAKEEKKDLIKSLKDRGLKGGIFKDETIALLLYKFIVEHSDVNFTNTPTDTPNKQELLAAYKYLNRTPVGIRFAMEEDLKRNFMKMCDNFFDDMAYEGEAYPDLKIQDYRTIARLILLAMIDQKVSPQADGYISVKEGLAAYLRNEIAFYDKEELMFLTRYSQFQVKNLMNLKAEFKDSEEIDDVPDWVDGHNGYQGLGLHVI